MRPLDDTRPGEVVALGFYGDQLAVDVPFSSVWRNATIREFATTLPVFVAARREH